MIPISLKSSFEDEVRRLGTAYHNLGLVTHYHASADLLLAGVVHSKMYQVALTRPDPKTLGLYCSCSKYRGGDLCLHLWAAIVEAEACGLEDTLLAEFEHFDALKSLPKSVEDDEDEYKDDDDEYDDDDDPMTIAMDPETQEYYRSMPYLDGRVHLVPMMSDEYEELRTMGVAMKVMEIDVARGRLVPLSTHRLPAWRTVLKRANPDRTRGPRLQPGHGGVLYPDPEVTESSSHARPDAAPVEVEWLRDSPTRSLFYLINVAKTKESGDVAIDIFSRQRLKAGGWGKPRGASQREFDAVSTPDERRALALLHTAQTQDWDYGYERAPLHRFKLDDDFLDFILPRLCATGRLLLAEADDIDSAPSISFDDGPAWELALALESIAQVGAPNADLAETETPTYRLTSLLRRGDEVRSLDEPQLILNAGLVFMDSKLARFDHQGAWSLATSLREADAVEVPADQVTAFLRELADLPVVPRIEIPEELNISVVQGEPKPWLALTAPAKGRAVLATPSFVYGDQKVDPRQPVGAVFSPPYTSFLMRDSQRESALGRTLLELGLKPRRAPEFDPPLQMAVGRMAGVVPALLKAGWQVEAEGRLVRRNGKFNVSVRSEIDWFDLDLGMTFADTHASLPALLEAVKRGDGMVTLDDGSVGLLPQQWLRQVGLLSALGRREGDHLRFAPSQAALLDLLLAAQPDTHVDETFARIQRELRTFEGVGPVEPPTTFRGELRDYQKVGLGWLAFLERFGFGGCLADDMGLGKTVQVLAWLESRRTATDRQAPTLVVVPRSIVWNWRTEAERFTPKLRVLEHTGPKRTQDQAVLRDTDLVLTTYGVLRRDVKLLASIEFDAVILDEAQAIKNPQTVTAKAARLLSSRIRLALSGTPIENHLGELWSLFDFLNPGMLGASTVFERTTRAGQALDMAGGGRDLLARALRPFILRRTKQQVATDLPPKLEQTLICELDRRERKLYRELRDHYRQKLLKKSDGAPGAGLGRNKIQVLEALLRLRQAACHPALLDPAKYGNRSSAKLDLLFEHLQNTVASGHKALVFSQFVKMLGLVRKRLDEEGIPYAYLDGRTRHRAAQVERFQNDPDVPLFLISIKAGGLGLNLTAAEYVFLLDPWWNPAVEAQAIDRTHRIGQQRPVFAYRLITRDTVEEKVVRLQQKKRDLAEAIINADNSLIRDLTPEDLELLLG